MAALLGAPSFRYRITDHGRRRAQLFLEHNQYVGAAPVPLSQYREYMTKFQQATRRIVTPAAVRQAVSHLVLSDRVVNQIGPAVTSGQSLFVYGAPGNGKTVIAQALHNLLEGPIAIPHALEVEGHIIRLFNPINHEPIPDDGADPWTTEARLDRRWVLCRRPKVMVGGELTMQSLDLAYSATTGFYNAPIQLMANGGLLVIDDFGRQACSPREMLNRWIVPLESRVDFLTLQSGQKFELPFMTLIVFATNVRPAELVDEAFLRRIQYKILAESPTVDEFKAIFASCCRDARRDGRDRARRAAAGRLLPPPEDRAARVPSPGPDQAGVVARLVPESTAAPDHGAARSGVRQLLRGRRRACAGVRVSRRLYAGAAVVAAAAVCRRLRARRPGAGALHAAATGLRTRAAVGAHHVAARPPRAAGRHPHRRAGQPSAAAWLSNRSGST